METFINIITTIFVAICEVLGTFISVICEMFNITTRDIVRFMFALICGIMLFSWLCNMITNELNSLFNIIL